MTLVSRVGEEIQSLSRFLGAQRLAFQKLLKKYKKWTGSQALGKRVESELFGRSSSFSDQTFEPLLAAWTRALVSVRAPFTPRGTWTIASEGKKGSAALTTLASEIRDYSKSSETGQIHTSPVKPFSSVAQLYDAAAVGTGLDLDAALATVPLGPSAGTATFWVHPDNIIQLQVLLLKHMRIFSWGNSSSSSTCATSSGQPSETPSSGHDNIRSSQTEDTVCHVVLDDIESFAKTQDGVVMSETSLQNVAASIRHASSAEAIIVVRASTEYTSPGNQSTCPVFRKAKMKRKHLESLFDPSVSQTPSHGPTEQVEIGTSNREFCAVQDLDSIRQWFAQHPEVRPLVQMQYRRTRFIGVGDNSTHCFWATLNRDISIKKVCSTQLSTSNDVSSLHDYDEQRTDAVPVLYAVLEIRWEDSKGGNLAQILDQSHLVSYSVGQKEICMHNH